MILILVAAVVTSCLALPKEPRVEKQVCSLDGVALIGSDLEKLENGGGIEASSLIECLGLCLTSKTCHYYTYVKIWKVNCFLKNEEGGLQRDFPEAVTGWVSDNCKYPEEDYNGPLVEVDSLNKLGCAYDDVVFLGKDIDEKNGGNGIVSSSFEECGIKCSNTQNCAVWNFVKQWKINCYLKSEIGEKSEMKGAVAGTLESCNLVSPKPESKPSVKTLDNEECRFMDTNFLGGDLEISDEGQGIETLDANACSAKCKSKSNCHYWTFVAKWKVNCYLKERLGDKSEFEGGESGSFGKKCNLEDESEVVDSTPVNDGPGCRFPETNFLGGDLTTEQGGQGLKVKDVNECKDQCTSRRICHYWTYVQKWEVNCYLKGLKGSSQPLAGATSGSLFIPCNEEVITEKLVSDEGEIRNGSNVCHYSNVDFVGSDLPSSQNGLGISTASNEDCEKVCFNQPECWYWTRVAEWKVDCYIKGKDASFHSKEGAISGSIGSPCTKSINSENRKLCTYEKISYEGGDLLESEGGNGIETKTVSDCASECQKRGKLCQYFTFVNEWKINCYLKKSFTSITSIDKATSGSLGIDCETSQKFSKTSHKVPKNPNRDLNGVCFFNDVALNGKDLRSQSIQNSADCAVLCYHTADCRYWVYDKDKTCHLKESFNEETISFESISGSIGYACQ